MTDPSERPTEPTLRVPLDNRLPRWKLEAPDVGSADLGDAKYDRAERVLATTAPKAALGEP